MKGKAEPLALYRPLRPRARFGSDVTRTHTTPLVGRDLERTLLIGTFERAAQQRSCQLVTLVGEPGVGKSRLCTELFAARRGAARARPLAAGPLPALRRRDRVLGAGGDRQGGVRDPRVGLARGRRGEARTARFRTTIRTAPGCWRGWRRWWVCRRSRRRRRSRSRPGGVSCESLGGGAARRCSCSRICTGPTTLCCRSSSIWPTGRRACRCSCSARRGRSCTSGIRRSGERAQRAADQPGSADRRGDGPLVSARCWSGRCCRRRRSSRCWSGRAATRSTRRSSCGCSPTVATSARRWRCRSRCRR